MDLQTMMNNMMTARRAEMMKTSDQLTVEELILKLRAVDNKKLLVVFDDGEYHPTGIDSWRGSYDELAFGYANKKGEGAHKGSYNSDEVEKDYPEYGMTIYKSVPIELPDFPNVADVIDMLETIKGKTFTGYKGGDYLMGKSTPLWVADYGMSSGFKEADENSSEYLQAVVDVIEASDAVSIITKLTDY